MQKLGVGHAPPGIWRRGWDAAGSGEEEEKRGTDSPDSNATCGIVPLQIGYEYPLATYHSITPLYYDDCDYPSLSSIYHVARLLVPWRGSRHRRWRYR